MDESELISVKLFGSYGYPNIKRNLTVYFGHDEEFICSMLNLAAPSFNLTPTETLEIISNELRIDKNVVSSMLTISTYIFSKIKDGSVSFDDLKIYLKSLDLGDNFDK